MNNIIRKYKMTQDFVEGVSVYGESNRKVKQRNVKIISIQGQGVQFDIKYLGS